MTTIRTVLAWISLAVAVVSWFSHHRAAPPPPIDWEVRPAVQAQPDVGVPPNPLDAAARLAVTVGAK